MVRLRLALSTAVLLLPAFAPAFAPTRAPAQRAAKTAAGDTAPWTFAVSGNSRNCGDFVMPAIAAQARRENDAFYWHLGDFRAMTAPDQDLLALQPGGSRPSLAEYQQSAWDDFLAHQMASFAAFPVFLSRGDHESTAPMTRQGYIAKFSAYLTRPEITAQRKADGISSAPLAPWYHWTEGGVDFINLDNSDRDEFSEAQLRWPRSVLDRDLAPQSGIRTIVVGMHQALPRSTGSSHAMDNGDRGIRTGTEVYAWLFNAQSAGMHVYVLASHSPYYAPHIFATPYWKQQGKVLPGWMIGLAGAHRSSLPAGTDPASRTRIYGFMQGTVHADGTIDFTLHQLSENDLVRFKWPGAPREAIHECFVHNADESDRR